MNKLDFMFGDRYDDGHGKYEIITIETDKTKLELMNAYKESCKEIDVDFKEICEDYEDSQIDSDIFDKLVNKLKLDSEYVEHMKANEYYIDGVDDFFDLLMKFIGYSIDFKYKKINDNNDSFDISFGYGLFH